MGQAPHFVKDEQLNELGGKPEVIESMFSVRLHTLRQQRTGTEEVRDVLHVLVLLVMQCGGSIKLNKKMHTVGVAVFRIFFFSSLFFLVTDISNTTTTHVVRV